MPHIVLYCFDHISEGNNSWGIMLLWLHEMTVDHVVWCPVGKASGLRCLMDQYESKYTHFMD